MENLTRIKHVLSVAVSEGESKKPPGDVVTVHLLNRGSDEVLRAIGDGAIAPANSGIRVFAISGSREASVSDPVCPSCHT